MPELTDSDRDTIDRARELAAVLHGDVDAWREYTGKPDFDDAALDLLGRAMVRLEAMVDLFDRLGDG